jgi:HTH-type transcriptional regulator / antitoxin HipB
MSGELPEITTRAPAQLGQALERCRRLRHLSQAELGRSAGLRQATVSKVESGAETTALRTVYALCAALNLELVLRPRTTARYEPRETT